MRQPKSVYNARYKMRHPDRVKASQRKYAEKDIEAHRERARIVTARYRAKDPDRAREMARKWRDANREKIRERQRAKRAKDPDKAKLQAKIYKNKRRARKLQSGGSHTAADIAHIKKLQKGRCGYCRRKLVDFHIDHIIALARGGHNGRANLQILCEDCNHAKHARDPIVFAREHFGMLL